MSDTNREAVEMFGFGEADKIIRENRQEIVEAIEKLAHLITDPVNDAFTKLRTRLAAAEKVIEAGGILFKLKEPKLLDDTISQYRQALAEYKLTEAQR